RRPPTRNASSTSRMSTLPYSVSAVSAPSPRQAFHPAQAAMTAASATAMTATLARLPTGTLLTVRPDGIQQQLDVSADQRVGIELVVRLEHERPHRREHDRRDQGMAEPVERRGPELAVLHAARDQLAQRGEPVRHDVLPVPAGQVRVPVRFGD